jgi:hypothetical protein
MKKILALALVLMLFIGVAWAQPTPPATPPSPESQGIQIPQPSSGAQAPPASESSQALVATSEATARAAAPSPQAALTSTYASTYLVVPPGTPTPNKFYIPYSPSTVAGCNFGQWLPMWLDVRGSGPLYSYEWYPDGRLVTQYLAYVPYPSWQKMWFYGDAPGWHTLQYYCSGWSNYIYVYVYSTSYYPQPGPSPYPPSPYPPYPTPSPAPGCNAQIIITSDSMRGYSVYVDGNYIGGDGRRGDHFDGTFSFTVSGNQPHTIKVYNQGFSYSQTKNYSCGSTNYLTL